MRTDLPTEERHCGECVVEKRAAAGSRVIQTIANSPNIESQYVKSSVGKLSRHLHVKSIRPDPVQNSRIQQQHARQIGLCATVLRSVQDSDKRAIFTECDNFLAHFGAPDIHDMIACIA
jgi:hypothetical protein